MCNDIAKCFQVTDYVAETVIETVSSTVVSQTVLRSVLFQNLIVGWAVKPALLSLEILSLGNALIKYFEKRSPL